MLSGFGVERDGIQVRQAALKTFTVVNAVDHHECGGPVQISLTVYRCTLAQKHKSTNKATGILPGQTNIGPSSPVSYFQKWLVRCYQEAHKRSKKVTVSPCCLTLNLLYFEVYFLGTWKFHLLMKLLIDVSSSP